MQTRSLLAGAIGDDLDTVGRETRSFWDQIGLVWWGSWQERPLHLRPRDEPSPRGMEEVHSSEGRVNTPSLPSNLCDE